MIYRVFGQISLFPPSSGKTEECSGCRNLYIYCQKLAGINKILGSAESCLGIQLIPANYMF